jgi:hypothetical protein
MTVTAARDAMGPIIDALDRRHQRVQLRAALVQVVQERHRDAAGRGAWDGGGGA